MTSSIRSTPPNDGCHALSQPAASLQGLARGAALAGLTAMASLTHAVEFGPFSLTGFAKAEFTRTSNSCTDCQWVLDEDKQRYWADALVPGREYKSQGSKVTLFQPYLAANFDLGKGYKLQGLVSQRWRDGKEDIPRFFYARNVAISHEDWGSLRVGAMTTRAWSVADFPYGTNIGLADAWGSSGAGYGLNTRAVRYTSRVLDVADGDLVVELTHDMGDINFKKNKPSFWEAYAQFHKGDLVVDAMLQSARNGTPAAWSHGPFTGLTPFASDDTKLTGSSQGIALIMARYQLNSQIELSGGIRANRWSGANAVITGSTTSTTGPQDLWNNMFNVDWSKPSNLGYPAKSTDFMLGARYKFGKWTASTGLAYLGKASTANPSERGQSNSALINTAGLTYDLGSGAQVYGTAGMVHYDHKGLSPMSMPGNSAFTNVDSRIAKVGNWFGLGAVYVF
jgi:predicted porin